MRCTRKYRHAVIPIWVLRAAEVRRIVIVHHGIGDLQIHSAELVDHLDKTVEAYPHIVVDMHFEGAFDRRHGRWCAARLKGPADLPPALVRDEPPEVAGDRKQG